MSGIAGLPAALPPIDHVHLGRYTLGNRALEIEVLQLFAGQAPETIAALATATDDRAWHVAAHTLKGSARAVGAWALARAAEDAERAGLRDEGRDALLAEIEALLDDARRHIDGLAAAA